VIGQLLVPGLALLAIVAVLAWTVVDCRRHEAREFPRAVLFDRDGRLVGATEELPLYRGGRHRAVRSR
jgi:hypothetical protein